jgi:outer membrane biosynthesis protein TonB
MSNPPTLRFPLQLTVYLVLFLGISAFAQNGGAGKPLIISPRMPADSRGETVYESQGEEQKTQPIVPGVYAPPRPIKLPKPGYPQSLRKKKAGAIVTVEGVITQDGDFIDAKALDAQEEDVAASALDAVARYKFHPATLDGKPIAILARVIVKFRVF